MSFKIFDLNCNCNFNFSDILSLITGNRKHDKKLKNAGPEPEISNLLSSTARKKSKSALEQSKKGRIFLRRKLFNEFWKDAVESSNSYLSICDLSMYSGKGESRAEKIDWEERTQLEINTLKEAEKIKEFDKIILFESSQDDDKNSIFDSVKKFWKNDVDKLRYSGIKSHYTDGENSPMIWECSRDTFSSWMTDINNAMEVEGQINSNDLGIFGGHLIGEEFKVDEASTIIGKLKDEDFYDLKFLYRFRIQKALIDAIKKKVIENMKEGKIEKIA